MKSKSRVTVIEKFSMYKIPAILYKKEDGVHTITTSAHGAMYNISDE
ncbi:MAG: hypothetical protein JETT_0282 [Candidatus Jettenia ecosi]|uniref:Uncharacterized protein n=1 Tax=Candidatus Jettenia ecosi TaxID=2494326 RepID=A0A533QFP8_9BACT|nr:MAG: hypothetical protein JETT_0282 [Candidatus Jettenia ecosi]